jgi:hypothetical protein
MPHCVAIDRAVCRREQRKVQQRHQSKRERRKKTDQDVISSAHLDGDSSLGTRSDGLGNSRPKRVLDSGNSDEGQITSKPRERDLAVLVRIDRRPRLDVFVANGDGSEHVVRIEDLEKQKPNRQSLLLKRRERVMESRLTIVRSMFSRVSSSNSATSIS